MTHRARGARHLLLTLAIMLAVSTSLPLIEQEASAQESPTTDRFTVTEVRGNQSAPRIDGKWVVYEDDRRSVDPTATPTSTAVTAATATPITPTPTQTPVVIVVTATHTPIVVTATPTATTPPASPRPTAP